MCPLPSPPPAPPATPRADPRWRRAPGVLALAGLLCVLWWGSGSPDPTPSPAAATAPASVPPPPASPNAPSPTPPLAEPAPGIAPPATRPAACPALRAAYDDALVSAREACVADLAATPCALPIPFPPRATPPATLAARLADARTACGADVAHATTLFCDAYPCLLAVHAAGLEVPPGCPLFDGPLPVPDDDGWVVTPIEPPKASFFVDAHAARLEGRLDRIRARLTAWAPDRPLDDVDGLTPMQTCGALGARVDALTGPGRCDAVRDALGCVAPADAPARKARAQQVLDAVDRLLDDLDDRCPAFAAAPIALDCEQLPCLLSFRPAADQPWNETVCDDPALRGPFTAQTDADGDRYVVVPVDVDGVLDDADVASAWAAQQLLRVFQAPAP